LRRSRDVPERTAAPSRCELVKNRAPGWRRSAFAA
jgi:hypothetical protein